MQFDEAKATYDHSYDRNPVDWNKTIHQVAVDKYAKMGYQLPEIGTYAHYNFNFSVNKS